MTCNDVEPNYRIGKRFKSLTSKNLIKYLILTSYKPNMRFYRITSKVVLFVKLSKISISATFLHGHSRGEISLWWVSGLPSSPAMLKKYIKADNLKVVEKLTDRYDYFK